MAAAESMVAARRALDDLYRGHAAEVYRYAYAVLGNHADAEDVTQTTFVNALRALERGERPRKPSNWLITITHNIVRQRFRQQQARPAEVELLREVAHEPPENHGPTMEELVRALQRIPQNQREALVLRELEGRSYDQIAETLNLTKSALETLLFRARRSLADELENAATCDRAALDLSRQLDGRLSRKERRRLLDHIAECPACERLQVAQGKQRRAFKGLALIPLPFALTFFKGAPSASAASGLPTIGTAGTGAVVGGGAATGGGFTLGGLAAGGVALKAAVVVATVSVASGVGYVGVQKVESNHRPATPPARTIADARAASLVAAQNRTRANVSGSASAKGAAPASAAATKNLHGADAATAAQQNGSSHSGLTKEHVAPEHVTPAQAVAKHTTSHPTLTAPPSDKPAHAEKPAGAPVAAKPEAKAAGQANGTATGVNGTAAGGNTKTTGQGGADAKQAKSPATPATPAIAGSSVAPATPATPATPAPSALERSNGSNAADDPAAGAKDNDKSK